MRTAHVRPSRRSEPARRWRPRGPGILPGLTLAAFCLTGILCPHLHAQTDDIILKTKDGGSTDQDRLKVTSSTGVPGPADIQVSKSRLSFNPTVGSEGILNLPATAPGAPIEGDIRFDAGYVRYYAASTWRTLALAGSGTAGYTLHDPVAAQTFFSDDGAYWLSRSGVSVANGNFYGGRVELQVNDNISDAIAVYNSPIYGRAYGGSVIAGAVTRNQGVYGLADGTSSSGMTFNAGVFGKATADEASGVYGIGGYFTVDEVDATSSSSSLIVEKTTSTAKGSITPGIGAGIEFRVESQAAGSTPTLDSIEAANIEAVLTNVVDGTETSVLAFGTLQGGSVSERMRIQPDGTLSIGKITDSAYLLDVNGAGYILGNFDVDGNTTLGDQPTDTVSLVGRVATDVDPDVDSARDLGSTTLRWKDLYLSGNILDSAGSRLYVARPTDSVSGSFNGYLYDFTNTSTVNSSGGLRAKVSPASVASGSFYGLRGECSMSDNIADATSTYNYAVYGEASGATNVAGETLWNRGVYGRGGGTPTAGSVINCGVYGSANGASDATNYGLYGRADGSTSSSNRAVYGYAASSSFENYGIYGQANAASTGTNYGVYGEAGNAGTNWAGYFSGNLNVTSALFTGGTQRMSNTGILSNTTWNGSPIATSYGGTGITSSGTTGNYLRSNGTTWTSSAIQAGDLPTLGTPYLLKNQADSSTAAVSGNLYTFTNSSTVSGAAGLHSEIPSASAGTGSFYGLKGWSSISDNSGTGTVYNYGVQGMAGGNSQVAGALVNNMGLYGAAQGSISGGGTVNNYGVYGTAANGPQNYGGYFYVNTGSGFAYGTQSRAVTSGIGYDAIGAYNLAETSTNGNSVYGAYNQGYAGNAAYAGDLHGSYNLAYGTGTTGNLFGVFATSQTVAGANNKTIYGVYSLISANVASTGDHYGVYAESTIATGAGTHYGVYGKAAGGATNWAGFFEGQVRATDTITMGSSATRFGMTRVTLTGAGTLFTHPGVNVTLTWDSVNRILTFNNNSGVYWDCGMNGAEDADFGAGGEAKIEGHARDVPNAGTLTLDGNNQSAGEAHSWHVTAVREGQAGPGFVFMGAGYTTSISGIVIFWY